MLKNILIKKNGKMFLKSVFLFYLIDTNFPKRVHIVYRDLDFILSRLQCSRKDLPLLYME